MKKVLLTGSTGLIGKEAIHPLKDAGYEVLSPGSSELDLFDEYKVCAFMEREKPEYLLHFAWITGGDYLTNPLNEKYRKGSLNLLKAFTDNGGKRAVLAGTCFEYGFTRDVLTEDTPLDPKTLYAECKVRLFEDALAHCRETECSFAWGRIFYVYGHNEKAGRLTEYLVNGMLDDNVVEVKCSDLVRDYVYSKEIAGAFVSLLSSDVTGPVNICTGQGVSLGNYAFKIAQKLGREDLLVLKNEPTTQPKTIIGDNSRLVNEVGYKYLYTMNEALDNIIAESTKNR